MPRVADINEMYATAETYRKVIWDANRKASDKAFTKEISEQYDQFYKNLLKTVDELPIGQVRALAVVAENLSDMSNPLLNKNEVAANIEAATREVLAVKAESALSILKETTSYIGDGALKTQTENLVKTLDARLNSHDEIHYEEITNTINKTIQSIHHMDQPDRADAAQEAINKLPESEKPVKSAFQSVVNFIKDHPKLCIAAGIGIAAAIVFTGGAAAIPSFFIGAGLYAAHLMGAGAAAVASVSGPLTTVAEVIGGATLVGAAAKPPSEFPRDRDHEYSPVSREVLEAANRKISMDSPASTSKPTVNVTHTPTEKNEVESPDVGERAKPSVS
jgi:hypothetical protein